MSGNFSCVFLLLNVKLTVGLIYTGESLFRCYLFYLTLLTFRFDFYLATFASASINNIALAKLVSLKKSALWVLDLLVQVGAS